MVLDGSLWPSSDDLEAIGHGFDCSIDRRSVMMAFVRCAWKRESSA
jgi:hypothetical protein